MPKTCGFFDVELYIIFFVQKILSKLNRVRWIYFKYNDDEGNKFHVNSDVQV